MTWQEYSKLLAKKGLEEKDRNFLEAVFELASYVHEGETRATGEPYITHPISVSLKIADLKLDIASIAAGLLHDAVEKNPNVLKTIRQKFGNEIAFLVDAVTKVDRVSAKGVKRALESVRKMFLAVAQDIRVVMIKLMDRLHNMETLDALAKDKRERIAEETLSLYAPLAERLGMWNIKGELEDLAFKHLWPREYAEMLEAVKNHAPERERLIRKIANVIESELKREKIKIKEISFRVKHLYSSWLKLEKYDNNWLLLSDLIALRIILEDVKDCYSTLGIIHKLWKPVPSRFKDYIALPKPNGYQSLHTSVFTENNYIVEFQIRTEEMHREAENGIAAHWAYSEFGKPKKGFSAIGKKFNWINQLANWHKEFEHEHASTEDLLEALKIDFFKDRIFVLTPKGDVIDLPKGATPLDFAYHIHSEIGNRAFGAKADGRLVSFSRELRSGEVVEITTQKNKKPSREWLHIVKTSLAKNRIRRALRITDKDSFLAIQEKPVSTSVYARNRVGLIKDISGVFASLHINIQTLTANRSGNDEAPILITFIPKQKSDVAKIENRLKKIRDVTKINSKIKS